MKVFKKLLSVFLTTAIMLSMICIGTVSAGAAESDYSLTLNGSSDEFAITLKAPSGSPLCDAYTSQSMFFVLIFTCGKENIAIFTPILDGVIIDVTYGIYSSGTWQNAPIHNPQSHSYNVGYDYESWHSVTGLDPFDFKAEFVIRDSKINNLLKNCTKVELGFEQWSSVTFEPAFETIWTKVSSQKDISSLSITKPSNKTYTGKNRKAAVTIKDGSKTLEKGKDYTLSYKNCKEIGTATVTIKGKGNYTGTKNLTYKIVPKKTTLKVAKSSDTKAKFTWTAVDGAEKYQIYYSANGGKYKKLATVSGSKTSYTSTKLDFKKNDYKFKIRSYATSNDAKYYSSYSKAVAVK